MDVHRGLGFVAEHLLCKCGGTSRAWLDGGANSMLIEEVHRGLGYVAEHLLC